MYAAPALPNLVYMCVCAKDASDGVRRGESMLRHCLPLKKPNTPDVESRYTYGRQPSDKMQMVSQINAHLSVIQRLSLVQDVCRVRGGIKCSVMPAKKGLLSELMWKTGLSRCDVPLSPSRRADGGALSPRREVASTANYVFAAYQATPLYDGSRNINIGVVFPLPIGGAFRPSGSFDSTPARLTPSATHPARATILLPCVNPERMGNTPTTHVQLAGHLSLTTTDRKKTFIFTPQNEQP